MEFVVSHPPPYVLADTGAGDVAVLPIFGRPLLAYKN